MKFRYITELNESIEQLDNSVYSTDSSYSFRDFILNKPNYYRAIYDKSIDRYFWSHAGRNTHRNILGEAAKVGFYDIAPDIRSVDTFITMPMDDDYKNEAEYCIKFDHYKYWLEWKDKNLCIVLRNAIDIPLIKILGEPSYYKEF